MLETETPRQSHIVVVAADTPHQSHIVFDRALLWESVQKLLSKSGKQINAEST